MAGQFFTFPPGFATSVNPSVGPNATPIPGDSTLVGGKNGSGNLTPLSTDSSGNLNVNISSSVLPTGGATAANQVLEIADLDAMNARMAGSLVPKAFDEIDLTYITMGNGTGQIGTAVYKLASVTVKTLTLTYDGSNRLSTVVAS